MKEKYFINARIIDPSQNLDEIGGLIVDTKGKIKAVGKNIKEKEHINVLGVHIANDLTWTKQINEVVSRARSISGWTMRIFQTIECVPMSILWN